MRFFTAPLSGPVHYCIVHENLLYCDSHQTKSNGKRRCSDIILGVQTIRHMRVPIQPIRLTGSLGYLTGSWREAMPYFTDKLINIRGKNH